MDTAVLIGLGIWLVFEAGGAFMLWDRRVEVLRKPSFFAAQAVLTSALAAIVLYAAFS